MTIKIYQATGNTDFDPSFMHFSIVRKAIPDLKEKLKEYYKEVYRYEKADSTNEMALLEKIYTKFNIDRPEDFKGHSLSVSDIVDLDGKLYYCDAYSWEEIA